MRHSASLAIAAALIVVFGAGLPEAQAQESGSPSARDLFMRGVELFEAEDYAAAAEAFQQSYAANPVVGVLYNIGMCQRALLRYVASIDTFERYLALGGDALPPERQQEVRGLVDDMRSRMGTLRVVVLPDDARVLVDGAEVPSDLLNAIRLAPGTHSVVARAEGHTDASEAVQIASQRVAEVALTLERVAGATDDPELGDGDGDGGEGDGQGGDDGEEPTRRPVHRRPGFWIGLIGGVVAAGLAVGLGVGLTRDEQPGGSVEITLP